MPERELHARFCTLNNNHMIQKKKKKKEKKGKKRKMYKNPTLRALYVPLA